ncbi:NS1 [CHeRI orbivirus 2-1]|nr:NS1 [CHeRI orbivirus 2-1]
MDQFIRFFNLSLEHAQLIRLCSIISTSWKCSHRSQDCLLKGICVKENFSKVCMDIYERQDARDLKMVINVALSMTAVRGDLWCNGLNHARNNALPNPEGEKERALEMLFDAYSHSPFQEEVQTLIRENEKGQTVYMDDSSSLIHCFYLPICMERETPVTEVRRLGRFLLVLYSTETPKTNIIWQSSPDIRHFVTETLRWGVTNLPECSFTGSKRSAQWLVWLPDTCVEIFSDPYEMGRMLRILDMDLKTIQGFESKDPSRICYQRFGVKGFSINTITDFLNMHVNGRLLIHYLLNRKARSIADLAIPMIVIRGFMFKYYTDYETGRWFELDDVCQCCYVEKHCNNKRIIVMDSRAMDILGRNCERSGRLIKHDEGNLKGISSFELGYGEMLSRQGDHWIAFTCDDSMDALIVTVTLIHRYLRGEGVKSEFERQVALNCLARCFLYWAPADVKIVGVIFKLMCYLLIRKKLEVLGTTLPWYDLGTFIDVIFKEDIYVAKMREKMFAAVACVSLLFLRITVHCYHIRFGDNSEFESSVKVLTRKMMKLPMCAKSIEPKKVMRPRK